MDQSTHAVVENRPGAVFGAETLDRMNGEGALIDAGGAYVLDLPVFSNGFEGGDTSAWSAAVGGP